MRDVYGTTFELRSPGSFVSARARIARWCMERYLKTELPDPAEDFVVDISATDHVDWATLTSESSGDRVWSLFFRHRDAVDTTLMWRVAIQVGQTDHLVRFTLRLAQESLESRVRPAVDAPGRPRIVMELADELDAGLDGFPLRSVPREVRSDDVTSLVDLLTDRNRRLPVLVTSVSIETGRPVTDPVELARQLVGVAHVSVIVVASATYELTDRIGKSLSVFDGAARLYWPGFTIASDPYVHRLWLGRTVESIDQRATHRDRPVGFSRHLLALLGNVSALRTQPDPLLRALRRETDARIREAERNELARITEVAREAIPDEFAVDFDRQSDLIRTQADRIAELEFQNEVLDDEKDVLNREIARLTRSFSDYQAAIAQERGDLGEDAEIEPSSIAEGLERVATAHPDALVVLPEAYESASETRYRHIVRAIAALRAIGEVAEGWHTNQLGMSFDAAFNERGFDMRPVGEATQGRHPNEYGRTFEGRRVLLGPHVAIGDGGSTDTIFRAYWYLDEAERRFVLGHVGRHLDDSTT